RVELEDVVGAHLQALARAPALGFGKFIISATTPFTPADLVELRHDAAAVLKRRVPDAEAIYAACGWKLPTEIDRVYVNARARTLLGWEPRHDFVRVLRSVKAGEDFRSPLARAVGAKGYHPEHRRSRAELA
ncbi:MAG TPA: NAD(P)-dependent oxidoreductase, partial [Burkholderiaceae bacterium]|nr:NAD(P)-dependent oxidoreductase [Burkholderiaceae bacterium]